MKRIVFLFVLLYGATLMAQNKAVAVTEVVDKEDKVSYATEIMVRTRLTAAISMKQGYTAYDRVDLQSIMSEQNFQRTGLVDDATIKRLGEMTGASLIMIPEVAMSDDGKIYVAIKMLDVTTAQTLMSTGELMGSSSAEVEEGCRALTAKVLGIRSSVSNRNTSIDKPVTLFGYLHVYPMDIGEFQTLPAQLLSAINRNAEYGYDSWRLPTKEELAIMRANSHAIPDFKNANYLSSDSSQGGYARLVTTAPSKTMRKEIRRKAILNLLGVVDDDMFVLTDEGTVVYSIQTTDLKSLPYDNFVRTSDPYTIQKYGDFSHGYGYIADFTLNSDSDYTNREYIRCSVNAKVVYKDVVVRRQLFVKMMFSTRTMDTDNYHMQMFVADIPNEDSIQREMQKYY